jgi:hypothetical protein
MWNSPACRRHNAAHFQERVAGAEVTTGDVTANDDVILLDDHWLHPLHGKGGVETARRHASRHHNRTPCITYGQSFTFF